MKTITLSWACIVAPFFLTACTNTVPTVYDTPTAHRATPRIRGPILPQGSDQATISGRIIQTATPDAVSIEAMPTCEAAEAILGVALSIDFTCTGQGALGLEVAAGDAERTLQAFIGAVARAGGSVSLDGSTVHVKGGSGTATAIASAMPPGLPTGETETVQGETFFTVADIDNAFIRKARTTVAQSAAIVVQRLSYEVDASAVEDLARELQLTVSAVDHGGVTYAVGSAADVAALSPFIDMAEAVTVPADVGYMTPQAVEALERSYPQLTVTFDDALGTLWLRGHPLDVQRAFQAVRSRVPLNNDLRIDAVFVSSSASDAERFEVDPILAMTSGDIRLASASASVGARTFTAVVSHLASYSSVNVLSRPSVVTSSGREAEFISGSKIPVVGQIDEEGRQSVTYEETGIVMKALPTVLPSGMVRLQITLEISGADGVGVLDNPNIATRSIKTTVEVTPGDVVKLSGLTDRQNGQGKGKVLGIFPSKSRSNADSTLSFFVSVNKD